MAAELVVQVLNGVVLGLLYGLIALGFMLILGTMEVINFSHGVCSRSVATSPWPSSPTSGGGAPSPSRRSAWGWSGSPSAGRPPDLREGSPVRAPVHLRRRAGPRGGDPPSSGSPRGYTIAAPAFAAGPFQLGFLFYSKYRVLVAVLAVALLTFVWWFLERTPYGAIIKAGAHDSEMVMALGIDLPRMRTWSSRSAPRWLAWRASSPRPMWSLKPTIGAEAVMPAFIVVVIGGIGSFWGAVDRAALLLGLASGLSQPGRAPRLHPGHVPADDRRPALAAPRASWGRSRSSIVSPGRGSPTGHRRRCWRSFGVAPPGPAGAAASRIHLPGDRGDDLGDLRPRVQPPARLHRPARLRARRLLRPGGILPGPQARSTGPAGAVAAPPGRDRGHRGRAGRWWPSSSPASAASTSRC